MSVAISDIRSVATVLVSERPLVSVDVMLTMLDVDSAERENDKAPRGA
jgi:hypothetical protein